MAQGATTTTMTRPNTRSPNEAADRIYHLWDEALGRGNPQEWLALYAENATLESPLIAYLTEKKEGVIHGHGELLPFLKKVAERKPPFANVIGPAISATGGSSCGNTRAKLPRVTRWTLWR